MAQILESLDGGIVCAVEHIELSSQSDDVGSVGADLFCGLIGVECFVGFAFE